MGHRPRVPEAKFSNPTAPWGHGPLLINGNMSRLENVEAVAKSLRAKVFRSERFNCNVERQKEHQRLVEERHKQHKARAHAAGMAGRVVQHVRNEAVPPKPSWFKEMIKALPGFLWKSKSTLKAEAELDELLAESKITGKPIEQLRKENEAKKIAQLDAALDRIKRKK